MVRHGETEWSAGRRHTGWTDLPLTARGEQQARALQPALAGVTFGRVLCSPLLRARQTCTLAGLASQMEIVSDLHEWDYGSYEGRTSASIHAERPGWDVFADGCPGGEDPAEVTERADRTILSLAGETGAVAIFTHGHFSRSLAVRWIDLPLAAGSRFALGTATISVLGHDPSSTALHMLERWNIDPARG